MYTNIATSAGPFRIIVTIIRWWLWADSCTPTLQLRRAHSGLSSLSFGGGCGPIHVHRHYCFGGPIQDYRHYYSVVAVGRFMYTDITASAGPFRIIVIIIRRWLWAHSRVSTSVFHGGCGPIQYYRHLWFGRPIQVYRRQYSAVPVAVGPFVNIKIFASVGLFRIIGDIIWWPWAHSKILTSPLWSAHSRLSVASFSIRSGPTQ